MKAAAFVLLAVMFTASCVPSLNALYTEHDLTFEAGLIGTWIDKETSETWSLSRGEKLGYALIHTDENGRRGEYAAKLVKIEDKLFLDIVPVKAGFTQNDLYKDHYFATHSFIHVISTGPSVQLSYLDPRWLKDHLAENPDAIRHANVGGQIALASSPKETQKFLLAHLNTRGAFSQPAELVRKRGA